VVAWGEGLGEGEFEEVHAEGAVPVVAVFLGGVEGEGPGLEEVALVEERGLVVEVEGDGAGGFGGVGELVGEFEAGLEDGGGGGGGARGRGGGGGGGGRDDAGELMDAEGDGGEHIGAGGAEEGDGALAAGEECREEGEGGEGQEAADRKREATHGFLIYWGGGGGARELVSGES
jgi:hypothetical protein